MARLILFALAAAAVLTLAIALTRVVEAGRIALVEAPLPDTIKTISFILLLLLLSGVVTGVLGGL